jgi:hypothetical protein
VRTHAAGATHTLRLTRRVSPTRRQSALDANFRYPDRSGRCSISLATTASCVLAVWMVPATLDLAVLDGWIAALKYGTWLTAGLLYPDSEQ